MKKKFDRLLQRIVLLMKVFLLGPKNSFYLFCIHRSKLFDRSFYLSANPTIHWLFHIFPERHYIVIGEKAGLFPRPNFSPTAYRKNYPDLGSYASRPFHHFVRFGQKERRVGLHIPKRDADTTSSLPHIRHFLQKKPNAIVLHLFYADLWPEILENLCQQDYPFDLFVSINHQTSDFDQQSQTIRQTFPDAAIFSMPNHGRDIFPFVHAVNEGVLSGYAAICKLHTKKSLHRSDGAEWRKQLISALLPASSGREMLANFVANPDAGALVPQSNLTRGHNAWGVNLTTGETLLRRLGLHIDETETLFSAGSMFWLKPQVVDVVAKLQLTAADFEPEAGQTNGTLAHAFEYALGHFTAAAGLHVITCEAALISARMAMEPLQPTVGSV